MITCKVRKLSKESRPRSAGLRCCTSHIARRLDATPNTLQLRPGPRSYNNSELTAKQALQSKQHSNRNPTTQTLHHPKCHRERRRRATHKGTSEGAFTAVGCKADLTSTMSLSAPPLAPGAPPSVRPWCPAWWRTSLVGHVPASVLPCVARRRAVLRWRLRLSWATWLPLPRLSKSLMSDDINKRRCVEARSSMPQKTTRRGREAAPRRRGLPPTSGGANETATPERGGASPASPERCSISRTAPWTACRVVRAAATATTVMSVYSSPGGRLITLDYG